MKNKDTKYKKPMMTIDYHLEGNIGTGKTTFCELLKQFMRFQKFEWTVVLEPKAVDEYENTERK